MKFILLKIALVLLASLFSIIGVATELSWDGYGNIKFGVSLEEISQKTGFEFVPTKDSMAWEDGCRYVDLKGGDEAIYMVENGILTRAEVSLSTETMLKIEITSSIEQIKKKHPEVIIKNHRYAIGGHYIIFYSPNKSKALLLEYYESKIQAMRAGVVPSVFYVEGCL